MYALVLIEYSSKMLNKEFTYKIPDNMKVNVGNKVKVLFNKKTINGIVTSIISETDVENLNEIVEVVNPDIYLNEELLKLGKYLSDVTFCTLIKAYQTMLPSSLKVKDVKNNYDKYDEYLVINKDKDDIMNYINNNKRSKTKIDILNRLIVNGKINKKDVSIVYKKLLEEGIIRIEKEKKYRLNNNTLSKKCYTLTDDQQAVVDKVILDKSIIYLLYGITGSGKTIVYIDLIKKVLYKGKTAIMLVPEISLTTQMVNRLYSSFGSDVAILHSGLSDGEKYDEYTKINKGEVKVVVGTRSAIFAPLNNIGIIIIDEEHTSSYKQESNPRYNTIDIAKKRSSYNNCPLI